MSAHISLHPNEWDRQRYRYLGGPSVVIGTLPNGMRYLGLRLPGGEVTVFLPADEAESLCSDLIASLENPKQL